MARNRTPEYINRIRAIEAPNGFKFDIANYLYNPDLTHEYPSFIKKNSRGRKHRDFQKYLLYEVL